MAVCSYTGLVHAHWHITLVKVSGKPLYSCVQPFIAIGSCTLHLCYDFHTPAFYIPCTPYVFLQPSAWRLSHILNRDTFHLSLRDVYIWFCNIKMLTLSRVLYFDHFLYLSHLPATWLHQSGLVGHRQRVWWHQCICCFTYYIAIHKTR